ncbi:MAG: IS1380 family transposase [Saprospiraceae bacterium]
MAKKDGSMQAKITKIDVTTEKVSGRGGIFFFLQYVENMIFYPLFEKSFGFLRASAKGLPIYQFIKQLMAHFIDGTDMSMSSFDRRKGDESYAAILENVPEQMASSHQIKRVFSKLAYIGNRVYRCLLHQLFIWRLNIEKPAVVILFGDTMVLDNDDADKREGVEPTYKKKKGFQPFHISWGPYLVDVIFRSGSAHSNHGCDVIKSVAQITRLIRKKYADVPIILLTDSGFLDDANFRYFEERLKIHYICGGKQYEDLKGYVQLIPPQAFKTLPKGNQSWQFIEFGNRLKSWTKFRRCLFTTLETEESGQLNLEFVKTDSFIYTNLGTDKELTEKLIGAGGQRYLTPEGIIELNRQRGAGELTHRSVKEFATKEQLPFERFGMNRAYYYFLVISHFLYEAFKRDMLEDILPTTCYPNTFRRRVIDFAAKIVATGGHIILKVTQTVFEQLQLKLLWERVKIPEPITVI